MYNTRYRYVATTACVGPWYNVWEHYHGKKVMGISYNVWELCIMCGSFVQCVEALPW